MRPAAIVLLTCLAIMIAGCSSPTQTAPSASDSSAPASPSPTVDRDLLLTISARVTTDSGETADLRLDVFQPVIATDPVADEWRASLESACGRELTYHAESSGVDPLAASDAAFIRSEVSVSATSQWSSDNGVALFASGYTVPAPGGILDRGPGHGSLQCSSGNTVRGAGSASQIRLATTDVAVGRFGFWIYDAALVSDESFAAENSVTWLVTGSLTECTVELTPAGVAAVEASGITADEWPRITSDRECGVGSS